LTAQGLFKGDAMVSAVQELCRSGLTPREADAWGGLLRVHVQLMRAFDAELETGFGITTSEFEVLAMLARHPDGRMRMADLAGSVLLSASGMSRLVERLQRRGLVTREPDTCDRRGALAVVTDAGRDLAARAEAVHWASVRERFLSHFTAEEQEALGTFWQRILDGGSGAEQVPHPDSFERVSEPQAS
jgi:DNA-binding MarR family transcriptional regulator